MGGGPVHHEPLPQQGREKDLRGVRPLPRARPSSTRRLAGVGHRGTESGALHRPGRPVEAPALGDDHRAGPAQNRRDRGKLELARQEDGGFSFMAERVEMAELRSHVLLISVDLLVIGAVKVCRVVRARRELHAAPGHERAHPQAQRNQAL
eukprot:scaffold7092_cov262-Pinguiococcus_pyrenoidosus.AAC.51